MVQTFLPMLNLQGPLCQLLYTSKEVHKVPIQSELKDAILVRFWVWVFFLHIFTSSQLILLYQQSRLLRPFHCSALCTTPVWFACVGLLSERKWITIFYILKMKMLYLSHSLCAQSDLKGLTEISVIDTDFISLCGLDLNTTSFVIPRASSQSQQ